MNAKKKKNLQRSRFANEAKLVNIFDGYLLNLKGAFGIRWLEHVFPRFVDEIGLAHGAKAWYGVDTHGTGRLTLGAYGLDAFTT